MSGCVPLAGIAPHARTESSEAGLYFIRDEQSAGRVRQFGHAAEIARRNGRQPFAGKGTAKQYRRQSDAVRREVIDRAACILEISSGQLLVRP